MYRKLRRNFIVDDYGNIGVPVPTGSGDAHGGGHWDVQGKKGGHINVYPGGKARGGHKPLPKLPDRIIFI